MLRLCSATLADAGGRVELLSPAVQQRHRSDHLTESSPGHDTMELDAMWEPRKSAFPAGVWEQVKASFD